MGAFTAPPIRLARASGSFHRAELLFEGIEQAGPSFEARIFLNKPAADERTPRDLESGYAGAFHVYGFGRRGPSRAASRASDVSPGGAVAPIAKRVRATDAIRAALATTDELTVTVVPVPDAAVVCDRVTVVFDEEQL